MQDYKEFDFIMIENTPEDKEIDFTEYDSVLCNCRDENEVQRYLEAHGNLIPVNNWLLGHQVHCSLIISKFKFRNQYVSDFVYLTKCSDEWYVVFVEIENPKKNIFNKDGHFTSDFNHAYEQIQDWERYLKSSVNQINILKSLKGIRHPSIMLDSNVSFKYLLIYGRGNDRDKTNDRRDKFMQKKTDSIKVCTFDSIKSVSTRFPSYMVLSPKGNAKFTVKSIPDDFDRNDQGLLAWYSAENLTFSIEQIEKMKALGYDIDSWLDGKKLTEGGLRVFDSDNVFTFHVRNSQPK